MESRLQVLRPDIPFHAHGHEHDHHVSNHAHDPIVSGPVSSRRDFLRALMSTTLAGASMLELAWHRAAWARAAAPDPSARLFDLRKSADGVFLAQARPLVPPAVNSNADVACRDRTSLWAVDKYVSGRVCPTMEFKV